MPKIFYRTNPQDTDPSLRNTSIGEGQVEEYHLSRRTVSGSVQDWTLKIQGTSLAWWDVLGRDLLLNEDRFDPGDWMVRVCPKCFLLCWQPQGTSGLCVLVFVGEVSPVGNSERGNRAVYKEDFFFLVVDLQLVDCDFFFGRMSWKIEIRKRFGSWRIENVYLVWSEPAVF